MKKTLRERLDLHKVSRYAIAANAAQAFFAVGLVLYALFGREFDLSGMAERLLICAVAFVVVWGALLDIRDARNARKIASQSEMLEDAYTQLEDLNGTLRAQRHDFKNHLQVVFGLIEMGEYKEAQDYIERVYGDVQLVSRALKTASPAVNALLAAKAADCEERGIRMEVRIRSAWQGLALPGWEMCRVLGNLIDNAIDAMADPALPQRRLLVETGEDIHAFTFRVFNTGSRIPPERLRDIFERGYTTKSEGRGMGLSIVAEIMEENGGKISVSSDETGTAFCGRLPKSRPDNAPGTERRE